MEKPEAAAPSGAASVTWNGSSSSSAGPITAIAMPPASIEMPAAPPTKPPSAAPVTCLRDATNDATAMIPTAATSAMAVAAFGFTDSSTRENA